MAILGLNLLAPMAIGGSLVIRGAGASLPGLGTATGSAGMRGSIFDGLLEADGFKARMRALADRGRRLARDYRRRPERRVRARGAAAAQPSAYARPVVVKAFYYDRRNGAYASSVAALANYLSKQGPLFDRESEAVDKGPIVEAWSHDRRVFHVVVSPNDGDRIDDMVGYGREVVAAWERRVGPLAWVAAVETKPDMAHPEGNRHLHVMVRGVQDGHDLFLDREVISHGLRRDAVEVATDRLGWMDERERRAFERRLEVMRERREAREGRDAPPRELDGRAL